jgi:hypothetical protein
LSGPLGTGTALGLLWRRQASRSYREQNEAGVALCASKAELRQRNDELSYLVKPIDFEKLMNLMETFGFYWLAWNRYRAGSRRSDADAPGRHWHAIASEKSAKPRRRR